jgi:competence protein ComEC
MKFLILALILANILIWIEIYAFLNQHEAVDFLDVGQGDGVLITEPKLAILYDAGPNGFKTISEISRVLGPTRKTIDLLLLSHADRDHYGGAFEILERYQVRAIGINPKKSTDSGWQELLSKAQEKNIPIIVFKAGSKIETNRQKFLFLHPPTPKSNSIEFKSDNQYSLVIKAFKQNTNFLLTGDIDAKVEQFLVEKFGNELDVDYLLIPHHGSKYSSSPIFLQITSPKLAIIQVGRNRYGHPHQQTLQKLQQMQIPIWRTDIQGSLVVE